MLKNWGGNCPPLPPQESAVALEIPSLGLLNSEKEMVKRFRIYFTKRWINEHGNLSVFYYENATNNGAESYHKTLNSYIKISHPSICNFMGYLGNIISDIDLELQRLLQGLETTRNLIR